MARMETVFTDSIRRSIYADLQVCNSWGSFTKSFVAHQILLGPQVQFRCILSLIFLHNFAQDFVQLELREPLRKATKNKKDLIRSIIMSVRETCAEWQRGRWKPSTIHRKQFYIILKLTSMIKSVNLIILLSAFKRHHRIHALPTNKIWRVEMIYRT